MLQPKENPDSQLNINPESLLSDEWESSELLEDQIPSPDALTLYWLENLDEDQKKLWKLLTSESKKYKDLQKKLNENWRLVNSFILADLITSFIGGLTHNHEVLFSVLYVIWGVMIAFTILVVIFEYTPFHDLNNWSEIQDLRVNILKKGREIGIISHELGIMNKSKTRESIDKSAIKNIIKQALSLEQDQIREANKITEIQIIQDRYERDRQNILARANIKIDKN